MHIISAPSTKQGFLYQFFHNRYSRFDTNIVIAQLLSGYDIFVTMFNYTEKLALNIFTATYDIMKCKKKMNKGEKIR